ncbi:MAG: LamG-like jellyroll fold domain-containing protein [Opitutales bacterium]
MTNKLPPYAHAPEQTIAHGGDFKSVDQRSKPSPSIANLTPILALPALMCVHSAHAQMSVHFEDTAREMSKEYLMHWDRIEAKWYGPELTLVENGDMGNVPASEQSFSSAVIGDTFGFTVEGVDDWDMADADTESANNTFGAYIAGLNKTNINIHGGVPMGLGVDNGNSSDVNDSVVFQDNGNRRDKIDDIGEALIITFDTNGGLMPAESGQFHPSPESTFTNNGLGEFSKLFIEGVWMKKYDTASLRQTGSVDVVFYDVSANTVVQRHLYVGADSQSEASNVLNRQEVEDGDVLILANPTLGIDPETNTPVDLTYLVTELWGFTFDIEFTPPADDPVDTSNPPQHAFDAGTPGVPGFSNIVREDGELVALFRTDGTLTDFDALRTVTLDFHRGYLISQTRGTSVGNAWGVFDISDITSANPTESDPVDRRPTQVGEWQKTTGSTPMHTYFGYEQELRVNNPGRDYYDLSTLPTLTRLDSYPAGYQAVGTGGGRSAYSLPYNYHSSGNGPVTIWNAKTGEDLATLTDHNFGAIAVPVGNLLILAKIRAGERALAFYDISDPERPALLDVMRANDPRWRIQGPSGAYEPAIFENYLILSNSLRGGYTVFIDFSDPTDLKVHHRILGIDGSERYLQFQDKRMFAGTEVIDLTYLDQGVSTVEHVFDNHIVDGVDYGAHQGEYMLPLGNLVVCAENSEQGIESVAAIYAFQAEPDVLGPTVGYHVPTAGATDQAVTSRIGLMIHETLDTTTLTDQTLKVFKLGDPENSIAGTRTISDKDVVTFTPEQALDYNTTYRVVAEGIKDIAGNPMERYVFDFTTQQSDSLWYPTIDSVGIAYVPSIIAGQEITFFTNATPDNGEPLDTLEYRWDFGDGNIQDWTSNFEATHTYRFPGKYDVKAQVRSTNAPHLITMLQLQPSVFTKPAGEDGHEPRLEAENGVLTGPNISIGYSDDSSGGAYVLCEVNSGVYWDFDSVGGHFDFQFWVAMPEGEEVPSNQSFSWRMGVYVSEIVDGVATNEQYLGEFATRSTTYEYKGFTGYLPREGRYRIQLKDGSGPREPRVDFVDIKGTPNPIRYEAEMLPTANITNGTTTPANGAWSDASDGNYVEGAEGFEVTWNFDAYQTGIYDITLRASSQSAQPSQMGLFVNNVKVQTITLSSGSFEDVLISVELAEGANTIELRDSEGGAEFNVDYLDIAIPAWEAPAPPQRSSQIALDSENRRIYTVNPDNDSITAIDADATPAVKLWERTVSKNPRGLGVDSQGRIWVTSFGGDSIDIVDPNNATNDQVLLYPHGSAPHDIVFNDAGTRAFVSFYGDQKVIQFDAESAQGEEISEVATGPYPTALALSADESTLLVSRFISGDARGDIYKISNDPASGNMTLESTIPLAADTESADGGIEGRGIPNYITNIAINPESGDAYIASQKINIFAGDFRDPSQPLLHDSTVRTIVSVIDTETNAERFDDRVDIDKSSQPSALWFDPQGNFLFVALQGNNAVQILDNGVNIGTLEVGAAPQGLTFDPATNRLYVKNFMSRDVSVHDLSNSLLLGNFSNTLETTIDTVASDALDVGNILLGKQIFYHASAQMSRDGYISCASCHQNGGHDGATWDFTQRGEGLRNTTDLRGRAGMANGNVHWSGNFDEIQDFENDIVNHFEGSGFLPEGEEPNAPMGASNAGRSLELDALAEYISSLEDESLPNSPHKEENGLLTANAIAGKALFTSLDCASCHIPQDGYTDSLGSFLHDVGTLKESSGKRLGGTLLGIDTPTLLGIHTSAPYFHDGRAATLEDVFDPTGDSERVNEVGQVHDLSGLTATERTQLIAFINELDALEVATPPAFTEGTLIAALGTAGEAYSESIAGDVNYAGNDTLTFSKVSGPDWLSVAANGDLYGTPTSGDVGENTFTVQVSAFDGTDTADLSILVDQSTESTVGAVDSASRLAHATFDSNAADSDNTLNLSLASGAIIESGIGQFAGSVRLGGSGAEVRIADHVDFNNGNAPWAERTIALWFTVDAVVGRQMIFEEGGSTRGFNIYLEDDTLHVGGWDSASDGNDTGTWAGTWRTVSGITANQWHHVALVLDASANPTAPTEGQFFAYLNGVEFDVGNSIGMQIWNHGDNAAIGGINGGSKYASGSAPANMVGNVDDFAVWNRALTASEVARLMGPSLNLAVSMINTSGEAEATKAWTFTDLDSTNPQVTKGSVTTEGSIGILTEADTFTITASSLDDWSTANASASTGDFQTYLSGIEATNTSTLDALGSGIMGVNGTWMEGTTEAIVLTVDTAGLPSLATLYLTEINFANYTGTDRTDFLIFRPSTNTVIANQWNANYNGPDSVSGNWALEDGDKIIIATGSANLNQFRFKGMSFVVADPDAL